MRAVAHGWKPSRIKGPTRAVAKEFVDADKRRDKVTGYQFGGGVPYRGVPPQRGMISRGATGSPTAMAGRMRGQMPQRRQMPQRGGGYGRAGGVPGTIGGFGGYQGPGQSPFGGQADQGGALRQMMQQMQQQRGRPGGITPGGPGYTPGGPGTWAGRGGIPGGGMPRGGMPRGGYDGQGPMATPVGGAQQRAMGALNQYRGAMPGGGGKMTPSIPGRRITGPPGKYPGGGNPMLRGRNPMMRGAQRYGGRRGMRR